MRCSRSASPSSSAAGVADAEATQSNAALEAKKDPDLLRAARELDRVIVSDNIQGPRPPASDNSGCRARPRSHQPAFPTRSPDPSTRSESGLRLSTLSCTTTLRRRSEEHLLAWLSIALLREVQSGSDAMWSICTPPLTSSVFALGTNQRRSPLGSSWRRSAGRRAHQDLGTQSRAAKALRLRDRLEQPTLHRSYARP